MLGGVGLARPRVVYAQQSSKPVIGFLRSTSIDEVPHYTARFRQGLKEAGFTEGENVVIEFRSADYGSSGLPALAAELVNQRVSVIVGNTPAAHAAKTATTTIPIVFAIGTDPVKEGFVANLNRPGGNITGVVFVSPQLGAKRLEMLRQVVSRASTVAVLINTGIVGTADDRLTMLFHCSA
jgi:putative ABC transport system substrate-binding protein